MNAEIIFNSKNLNDSELFLKLKNWGIVVLPNFYSETELIPLRKEFDSLLDEEDKAIVKKMDYSLGKGVIAYKKSLNKIKHSATLNIFANPEMDKLTKKYLGQEVDYNSEIFVVKDVVGSKHHANDLHFDVLSTFKYFIYLTDTTVENGAFTCVPGSHRRTAEIRKKLGSKISFENRELSRDLPYTEEEVIPIEGKAGTLIIFDTDVFHKAGFVSKGERCVMRGHNRISPGEKSSKENTSILSKLKSKLFGK